MSTFRWALLSRAQKREVVRIAGAGVLSTAFFALPLLLVVPDRGAATTLPTSAVPVPDEPTPSATPATASIAEGPARQSVVVRAYDVAVAVAQPKLSSSAFPQVRNRESQARAREKRPVLSRSKSPSFRGRLARMVAGDGRYPVRPFPTVGN